MNEMTMRVATAIMGGCLGNPEAMARAAIEAMREPTEDMTDAATHLGFLLDCGAAAIWRAMIDEALAKAPSPAS